MSKGKASLIKKDKENKKLWQLLDDRGSSLDIESYKEVEEKEKGYSAGFIGKKDESTYMLKLGETNYIEELEEYRGIAAEKRDLSTEYITSSLYERILKDRAPKIGLVKENEHYIYLKSKFLDEFQGINTYKEVHPDEIEFDGFEKVLAACLYMGEVDYHGQNIGVARGGDGAMHAVKIDHGRTGFELFGDEDEVSIMQDLMQNVKNHDYSDLVIDAKKFQEAVTEINSISNSEIDNLIKNRIYNLKKTGFKLNFNYINIPDHEDINLGTKFVKDNPKEGEVVLKVSSVNDAFVLTKKGKDPLVINILQNDNLSCVYNGELIELPNNLTKDDIRTKVGQSQLLDFASSIGYTEDEQTIRYNNLEKFYTEKLKQRKEVFKDIEKTLDIISKIDGNNQFKNGGWLKQLYGEKNGGLIHKNPILFALEGNLTIENENPILWAVKHGYGEQLQSSVLNTKDAHGYTALNYAVINGEVETIEKLKNLGANLNIPDQYGDTALHVATEMGSEKVIDKLIEIGAKLDIQNEDGDTALHKAAKERDSKIVNKLLAKGAKLSVQNNEERTALHYLAANALVKDIEGTLDLKAALHIQDDKGRTAMHYAASAGEIEGISRLHNLGDNVDVVDEDGYTALYYAVEYEKVDAISKLIDIGANLNFKDNEGNAVFTKIVAKEGNKIISFLAKSNKDKLPKIIANIVNSNKDNHIVWKFVKNILDEVSPKNIEMVVKESLNQINDVTNRKKLVDLVVAEEKKVSNKLPILKNKAFLYNCVRDARAPNINGYTKDNISRNR
jgi:ankyrin repeat protein